MSDISIPITDSNLKTRSDIRTRLALGFTIGFQILAIFIFTLIAVTTILWMRNPNAIGASLSPRERIIYFVLPYLIGLIYLSCGLWVLSLRREDSSGRNFSILAASLGMVFAGFLDHLTSNSLASIWPLILAVASGALIQFSFIFPEEAVWRRAWQNLRKISLVLSILMVVIVTPPLLVENADGPVDFLYLALFYLGISTIIFGILNFLRRIRSKIPEIRQQSGTIIWALVAALLPTAIWFFLHLRNPGEVIFSPILFVPYGVLPISISYAMLRYRLMNTDYVFSRAVLYAALTILAVVGYGLIVSGLGILFGNVISITDPYILGLIFFMLAVVIHPVRSQLQKTVDQVFFRGRQVYQDKIREFGSLLSPSMGLFEAANLLRRYLEDSLSPGQIHIFILDGLRDLYFAAPDDTGHPTTDIQFSANSPLPYLLSREQNYIYLQGGEEVVPALVPEKHRITLLSARLFVPMPGRNEQVIGFVALGPRRSEELYKNLDLSFLTALCRQSAMAFERARVVADLERRVNEMNALMRVSQGINITMEIDDTLELIYAQTTRIVPAKDFWVVLFNRENNRYHYAFYLVDDQRLIPRENKTFTDIVDLAQDVIRTRRPIVTDDYRHESFERGISPQFEGIYAWAGVPLNTGAETIGALSLGSRDRSIIYSPDQIELLQAIADQAAGALIKARLLDESERGALQLKLLNEVARNLTSTLELSTLLDQILDYAIDIIGCEAGTLFLVDEDTGELVFEVVKGPVADELAGKRLAPGTGHVGKSVETGKSAIVNEARQTEEWAKSPDRQTGFHTRDLLLAPMLAQERVIGVIEVINRQDGLPFTNEDQGLLTAFSSQAAIALVNARLYTLTDQQLAERVDELSVMQRIDRELNTSLEVSRAMRITLEWAMRLSGADAGLVGAVSENGLRIMADQGYADELDPYRDSIMPVDIPGVKSAVDEETTQQFRRSDLFEQSEDDFNLLKGAQSQIIIPIRREEEVIGLILLESVRQDPWSEDIQEFLSRLSDHAAIAIANAQLFLQVQEADLAKSEFVSFVSHELKTPMTSIRGYTDLLLGGAVGELNEAQNNFLNTVRSNVNRMATLVSDLTDISRIESGRLRLEYESVQITGVVAEVVRAQAQGLDEKRQLLKQQIDDDLPPVWGDKTRIIQILTNLLSNANKYTPNEGTITIRAEQHIKEWDQDGGPEVILISVEDTGIGMSEEDQNHIFTKFFRSADPKAREVPGTGLGLSITKNLVEMQGGRIWFESEYGEGTMFRFTLPVSEI